MWGQFYFYYLCTERKDGGKDREDRHLDSENIVHVDWKGLSNEM